MSTDLHLICRTHNEKSDEVGNAYRSIVEVRDAIARRGEIRDIWDPAQKAFDLQWSEIHWMNTMRECLRFVITHADCNIEIIDEYGKYYDITAEPTECYAVLKLTDRRESYISMCDYFEIDVEFPCQRDQADGHQNHIHESTDSRGVEFKITWNAWKGKGD